MEKAVRSRGVYPRRVFKGDTIYSYYQHREFNLILAAKSGGVARVQDDVTTQMVVDGVIAQAQKDASDARIRAAFDCPEKVCRFDDFSVQEMYAHIHSLRREALGEEALARAMDIAAARGIDFDLTGGLDQSKKKEALLQRASAVALMLCEAELCSLMRRDMETLRQQGKRIHLLCGGSLSDKKQLEKWLNCENVTFLPFDSALEGMDCLLVYGEDGLLQAPPVEAIVHAVPRGYYAQAAVNQLGCVRPCLVYVPAHFDVTRYVPLISRARLTYWQLAKLWEAQGDGIYDLTVEALYRRYPQYFINMYQNGAHCAEAAEACRLRVPPLPSGDVFAGFDAARDEAIRQYLSEFDNIRYFSGKFYEEQQTGVLVHALRIKGAKQSGVISCEGETPRQVFKNGETGVVSNFLFFLTPKLAALYNDLRADRPYEMASAGEGHLDYKLCDKNGQRVETFPLFRKMCIARKEDGGYLFFNFRLGGGEIRVNGHSFRWEKAQVDGDKGDVIVYTPYLSNDEQEADRLTYRKMVGEGRVNLVILQDRIHCVRYGSVVLPSVGVVVSLTAEAAQGLLEDLPALADGYFDASGLRLAVHLDAPEGVEDKIWRTVRWAYGGGLSLIKDGKALSDCEDQQAWFAREGWMSPLSRQTQESALHVMAKHPRTAIGTAKNGDMVILVYSGRTQLSSGADYNEMCYIAQQMFPDVTTLMNVDGGASAVLGLVHDGTFVELSYPATSSNSCAGMVRPVKTLLYVSADKA